MKQSVKTIGLKIAKISGISFAILLFAMILFPILFHNTIADEVKKFANGKLNGELNFKEANLSFFNHFPSLTLTLTQFSLNGSQPYKDETLLKAEEVAFGINVKSLIFDKKVKIDKIFISDALVNVKVNEKGEANYNVYASDKKQTTNEPSTASIRLDKIDIKNCNLV